MDGEMEKIEKMDEVIENKPTPQGASDSQDINDNKLVAAIGYLGILFIIPLIVKKDSPFARFHGKQGLTLTLFAIALAVVAWIPFIGWIVGLVGWLITLVIGVIGIINALSGKTEPLPVIGQYADQVVEKLNI